MNVSGKQAATPEHCFASEVEIMYEKKKILVIFGTRPEAIKLARVYHTLAANPLFEVEACVTAQHREMLDQVLAIFGITPKFDLDLMRANQTLGDITAAILTKMKPVFTAFSPDLVLVHGDTTTAMAAALAAYYEKIAVGHVEAGLRTHDKYAPWPEEMNRQLVGAIADFHFAPTMTARDNLLREGIALEKIWVTGNTVIDSLLWVSEKIAGDTNLQDRLGERYGYLSKQRKLLLVTAHRRESFGDNFIDLCTGLLDIVRQRDDVEIVYPVHLNPQVQTPVNAVLRHPDLDPSVAKRIHLIKPLEYVDFVYLMNRCHLVLTDSGGIQEEAPSLGKPVLVLRDVTERPEAVASGNVRVIGTQRQAIISHVTSLLSDQNQYHAMASAKNPYGEGDAAEKIDRILTSTLAEDPRESLKIFHNTQSTHVELGR
jgi:UDP-N-acetylglucosamine 2-epimerase (non-hydrolysing)